MDTQTKIMDRQITETREAAKQAGEQSMESLKASAAQSKAALDASIEAMRLDQRAWVGIKAIGVRTLEAGKPIAAEATITNTGKTFALDTHFLVSVRVSPVRLDIDKEAASPERIRRTPPKPLVLFPNFDLMARGSSPIPITEIELSFIKDGKWLLYLFGEIHYSDIFRRQHTTEFCGLYDPPTGLFGSCGQHERAN